MRRAGGGEVSAGLQHLTPMREHWPLPELRIVHAFVRWSPASVSFLDHYPEILWGHPVLSQPLGYLRIRIVLEEYPIRGAEGCERASGTGWHREQSGVVVQLFVGFRQIGIDTRGILDKNHLPGLIGFIVPSVVPRDGTLRNDLVFEVHIRNELHGLDGARGMQGHGLVVGFDQFPPVGPDD